MTIKADRWFIQQCMAPTHRLIHPIGTDRLISPPYSQEEQRAILNWNVEEGRENMGTMSWAVPLTEEVVSDFKPMIEPFFDSPVRYVDRVTGEPILDIEGVDPESIRKVISFGTSSYGYDVRLDNDPDHIRVFTNVHVTEINPKKITDENFAIPEIRVDEEGGEYVLIPPHSYLQAPTMEYFRIPRDVLIVVVGKSTLARSALICNVTPIEPDFEGTVIVEIANSSSSPVRCYLAEGCAQFLAFQSDEQCLVSYKDKAGKYFGQTGMTYAKV